MKRLTAAALQSGLARKADAMYAAEMTAPDRDEQVLDLVEAALGDQQHHQDRRGHGADRQGHAEELEGRPDARVLGERRAEVGDQHRHRHEGRPAHAEAIAHEPRQALPRGQAQPSADLLGEEEDDLAGQDHPQERVAEVHPGQGVGRDAAGVVVGKAADQAGTHDGEDADQAKARDGCGAEAAQGSNIDVGKHADTLASSRASRAPGGAPRAVLAVWFAVAGRRGALTVHQRVVGSGTARSIDCWRA